MIRLQKSFLDEVEKASHPQDLHGMLQKAIELEHATIPPYLTAMFSLKPGTNREIWEIIHSIVLEEMLHMSIASNILNALDGSPKINHPDFIPSYPGPLPMGIADQLTVGLEKYSPKQVKDVFMEIEEPENPLEIPLRETLAVGPTPEYSTIGQFYMAIQKKIQEVASGGLPGNPSRQFISRAYPSNELFPIRTVDDAVKAIDIIVEQGEGTSTSPLDDDSEIAHYYRFQELSVGRRLIEDASAPNGYSFSGPLIQFSEDDVFNIFPNTRLSMLTDGTEEKRAAEQIAIAYTRLLNGLHQVFNGKPDQFSDTLGLMFDLKLYAEKLCAMEFPGKPGYHIGPVFEYLEG